MEKVLRWLAAAVVLAALFGCAAPKPILNAENRGRLGTTDVVVQVALEEIYAQIVHSQASMYGGGGLILALIDAAVDNSRAKTAEKTVEPYRNALINYDYVARLEGELQKSLAGPGFTVESLKMQRRVDAKSPALPAAGSPAGSVLRLQSYYCFTPDFSSIIVGADAKVSLSQAGKQTVVHDKTYAIVKAVPAGLQSTEEKWTANNGAALRAALDQAIVELVERMHRELIGSTVQAQN